MKNYFLSSAFLVCIGLNGLAQQFSADLAITYKVVDENHNVLNQSKVTAALVGFASVHELHTDTSGFVKIKFFSPRYQRTEVDTSFVGSVGIFCEGYSMQDFTLKYHQGSYVHNDTILVVLKPWEQIPITKNLFKNTTASNSLKDIYKKDSLIFCASLDFPLNFKGNNLRIKNEKEDEYSIVYVRSVSLFHTVEEEDLHISVKKDKVKFKLNGQEYKFIARAYRSETGHLIKLFRIKKNPNNYDTIVNYDANISAYGDSCFLDGKPISKEKFIHLTGSTFEEQQNCSPCLFMSKNEQEHTYYEYFGFPLCRTGIYKSYNSNGTIRGIGHYKGVNDTKNRSIEDCDIKDGEWIYHDSLGKKLYSKFWKDNVYLRTEPTSKTTVIDIKSSQLDTIQPGTKIDKSIISNASLQLVYSNALRNNKEEMYVYIYKDGSEVAKHIIDGYDLTKMTDIFKSFDEKAQSNLYVAIYFYSDGEMIKNYGFNLKE